MPDDPRTRAVQLYVKHFADSSLSLSHHAREATSNAIRALEDSLRRSQNATDGASPSTPPPLPDPKLFDIAYHEVLDLLREPHQRWRNSIIGSSRPCPTSHSNELSEFDPLASAVASGLSVLDPVPLMAASSSSDIISPNAGETATSPRLRQRAIPPSIPTPALDAETRALSDGATLKRTADHTANYKQYSQPELSSTLRNGGGLRVPGAAFPFSTAPAMPVPDDDDNVDGEAAQALDHLDALTANGMVSPSSSSPYSSVHASPAASPPHQPSSPRQAHAPPTGSTGTEPQDRYSRETSAPMAISSQAAGDDIARVATSFPPPSQRSRGASKSLSPPSAARAAALHDTQSHARGHVQELLSVFKSKAEVVSTAPTSKKSYASANKQDGGQPPK